MARTGRQDEHPTNEMTHTTSAPERLDAIDLSPERFGDGVPFDDLAHLRREAPVWWSEGLGCWVVTPYDLVEACNRDWSTFSSSDGVVDPADAGKPQWRPITGMDPPEHSDYRRSVRVPFTPIPIGRLEPMVRAITAEAMATFVAAGGGDVVVSLGAAIPFRVMSALTGAPAEDETLVVEWTNRVMPNSDPEYRPTPASAETARRELSEYCREVADRQRHGERAPLAEMLFSTRLTDRPLSVDEVANFLDTFIVGGTETTRQLLTHSLLALLDHPDQAARLRDGSVPLGGAVEELVRWASPVLHHSRRATAETTIGGATIAAGERVTLWIVSANRDHSVFSDGDRLELARDPNPHVAFGAGGPHYCLGAHLARLETRIFVEALLPLVDRIEAAGPAIRVRSNFFNGIKRFPVALVA